MLRSHHRRAKAGRQLAKMTTVPAAWQKIERVLWQNAHSVFVALGKPATDLQIRRLEGKLGARLPRDFVKSLKIHDGLRNSYHAHVRLFNYWSLLPLKAILTEWKMMTDLQAECEFAGCRGKVSSRIKNDAHWRAGWIPILDADGDKIVIDLDPGPGGKSGQILEWSNSGNFATRLLADSFGDWWSDIADRFSQRQFRLDVSGEIWLDPTE